MLSRLIIILMTLFAFVFPISLGAANGVLALVLLVWILEGNFQKKFLQLKKEKIVWIFLAIGVITLLSALGSDTLTGSFLAKNKDTLLKVITTHYILLPFIIIVILTSFDRKNIDYLLTAFLSAIAFSELVSYLIFLDFIDVSFFKAKHLLHYLSSSSDPSPFMHHTEYSVCLSIAAIILLHKIIHTSQPYTKVILTLFLLSATTNLFVNGGRTGQIAYILSMGTYLFFYFQFNLKMILGTITALGIVLATAYTFSPNFQHRSKMAVEDIQKIQKEDYTTSWGIRVASHEVVLHYLISKPSRFIFGAGAGNTRDAYLQHAQKHFTKYISQPIKILAHVHNQFLEYWMDGGIIVLLLFLFYFVLLAKRTKGDTIQPLSYAFIVTVMFACMTDVPFFRYQPAMLFYLMTGYLLVLSQRKRQQ